MVVGILREVLVVLGLGVPFFFFEWRFAAHRVEYRSVLARDVAAYVVVVVLGIPTTALLAAAFANIPALAALGRVPALPPWVSIPIAVLGRDFAFYWTHRLIHTRPLWRMHRWHHAPRHMYWLAGARTSVLQGLLYALVPIAFVALRLPAYFLGVYALFEIVVNHWMHANLGFRSRWLEAVIITPRIHHVHHSCDPRHYGRNFGSVFSFWDRMFGTYYSPDDVTEPLEFGIPEKVSPPRIVLGV